ncbi:MAG: PucR family transcriptional regulator [Enterocloster sp.]
MSYTLQEMVQTEPFCDLQIIAGERGITNPVRYVGVLEAPDSVDFVKEYEFVLTTGYIFSNQNDQMLRIIRQLHEHRAAALGIKMFRYIKNLPEEAKQLADEYELPIFFIPNKYSWHELILPLILNISAMGTEEGGFYQNYDQLIYGMQHSQTFFDFLSRAGELLSKPLTLFNGLSLQTLHYPTDFEPTIGDPRQWKVLLTDEKARVFQNGKIRYYHPQRNLPGFLAVELQMLEYQYLILWDCPEPGAFNQFNYLVYSLMLVRESMQNRREMQKNQMLQEGLNLYKIIVEGQQEQEIPGNSGIFAKGDCIFYPALISFAGSGGRMEERITVYNPVVVRLLEHLEQKCGIHGFTDLTGGLHLLIPSHQSESGAQERLIKVRRICAGVMKTVQRYFPDLEASMVTGRQGRGLEEIRLRHKEMMNTIIFLKNQRAGNLPKQLYLHDAGMSVFLANPQVQVFLEDFLREYFDALKELDETSRTHLLQTAATYAESGFNTREAARSLGIHHNTVRNRLEQFLNLTGLDLKRKEDLLIFLFYLQIMETNFRLL